MACDNILSNIKEKFNDPALQIGIRKVPFYISPFFREDKDIIFIHKERTKSKLDDFLQKHIDSDTFDGDITGQPLEAPHCEFDSMDITQTFEILREVTEADHHTPLSLLDARSILNYCTLYLKPQLPLWILTDGCDLKKTVLLSVENNEGWITRSWLVYKGFMEPPLLESLLNRHAQFSNSSLHLTVCEVKCTYDILKKMLTVEPYSLHSSISLHAFWSKMSLEPPLLHRSMETRVNAKVRIGHEEGGLQLLWKQICLLDSYLTLMSNNGADNCPGPVMTLPSSAEILKCLEKETSNVSPVSRILDLLMEPVNVTLGPNDAQPSLNHLINQYSFTDKPPTDITDRLWFLFIECKSYQELSACLKELFMELNKKNLPAPFISPNNISRLGRALAREGGVSIHDPIEYLVEIGIEKLKKELLIIFSKAQIATANNLNIPKFPNFSEISSVNWLSTTRKWHLWLCQVYCALEILWSIQGSLCLSNTALFAIAPNILMQFCGADSKIESFNSIINNPLLEVEIPIPVKNVEKAISIKVPLEWSFSLTTSTQSHKSQSIFYKTSRKNCFPAIEKHINIDEPDLFHWFEFQSISQLFS